MSAPIPASVVSRLPLYLRALERLAQRGQEFTSSRELGALLGIGAAQIRKDLSRFGGFGKQGTGYPVADLLRQLKRILKVDRDWPVALVGVGNLGRAIVHYQGFARRGFRIRAIFDNDPD